MYDIAEKSVEKLLCRDLQIVENLIVNPIVCSSCADFPVSEKNFSVFHRIFLVENLEQSDLFR